MSHCSSRRRSSARRSGAVWGRRRQSKAHVAGDREGARARLTSGISRMCNVMMSFRRRSKTWMPTVPTMTFTFFLLYVQMDKQMERQIGDRLTQKSTDREID